jgi:putative CocE/NonD family hydrolase
MTKKRMALVLASLAGALLLFSCGNGQEDDGFSKRGEKIPLPQMVPENPYAVVEERGIPIVRPDDPEQFKLYVNVVRPDGRGRFPTLLVATAYRREFVRALAPDSLVSSGYAVVLLDVMGTGSSEGGWEALSAREIDDVAWVIDNWIPEQPWSNGKVGMYGPSYMGITSFLAAGRRPRHLKAIFPGVIHADTYRDIFFQGGIFEQEFMLFWARFTLGLSFLPPTQLYRPRSGHVLEDVRSGLKALEEHREQEPEVLSWLAKTTDGPFFDERSPMTYWGEMAEMPIMTTAGWWGIFTRGSMLNYTEIVREKRRWESEGGRAGPMRIIVGPWYHTTGAFMEGLPSELLQRRWFDWHLKADEHPDYRNYDILDPSAPVILYVLGRERWRREKEWPLTRARYETLYLSGKRQEHDQNESLNNGSLYWSWEMGGDGPLPDGTTPSGISYDPMQDPSRFTGQRSRSSVRWGGGEIFEVPHAEDESENEVYLLTFSTAKLDRDVEVTGPAVLRLWARSDFGIPCEDPPAIWYEQGDASGIDVSPLIPWAQQRDVHWTVNVNDVFPDGRVRNITSGWLAASHRPDPARPDWTQDGYDPFLYPEDRSPSSPESGRAYEYVIEIWPTSNVFLAGHQIRIDVAVTDYPHFLPSLVPSENDILHDEEHPSRLVLPVVDDETTDPRQWVDDPEAFFAGREKTWTDY